MKNKALITVALVLTLTACTDMGSSQQELSTEFEGYGSNYTVTIEKESLSEPAVPLIEYQESEDTIDLTNIGKTEYFPQSKVGDVIGGQTIKELLIVDSLVYIEFSGEVTVEIYYFHSDSTQAPPFQMVLLSGTSLELPDLTDDYISLRTMNIGGGDGLPYEYMDTILGQAPENSYPRFYCKAKVDNITISFLQDSSSGRYGEIMELLEFRFEQFVTIEEVYALYE